MRRIALLQSALIFFALVGCILASEIDTTGGQVKETILYEVSPVGVALYQDLGQASWRNQKVNLCTFTTRAVGFSDTEKICSDPRNSLPLWIERDISLFLHKEYLTEEYFPQEGRAVIKKFEDNKLTAEYKFNAAGAIHNGILLPFSLRKVPRLGLGWSCLIRMPDEYRVELVSVEDVVVPAGKFKAYHLKSRPEKFEVWITADASRIPVKIKGVGGLPYALLMKKYVKQQ